MSLILSLETSSPICSVALHRAGVLIGQTELRLEKSHSSHISFCNAPIIEPIAPSYEATLASLPFRLILQGIIFPKSAKRQG